MANSLPPIKFIEKQRYQMQWNKIFKELKEKSVNQESYM